MRIFCTLKISWNRISDWLPIVFHFGTENWEEQLKDITLYFNMLQGKNYHEQCYTCSDCTESLSGQFVCAAPNDEIVCFQCDTKRRG